MLVMWRDAPYTDDQQQIITQTAPLDDLLDRLHQQSQHHGTANAIQIYAGDRYPEEGHGENGRWIPPDPGDGPQPVLFFTLGTDHSPLYWIEPSGHEHTSLGIPGNDEPEFEYLYGGQESYAPAWSLIPTGQARQAARLFMASGGQQPANITWHTTQP
jgi:hypothetical protein